MLGLAPAASIFISVARTGGRREALQDKESFHAVWSYAQGTHVNINDAGLGRVQKKCHGRKKTQSFLMP